MAAGARVTDEVNHFRRQGDLKNAVRVVRNRVPERLRWRSAVAAMSMDAGINRGIQRMRIEEPIREIVLDLSDRILRRESVLDARRYGVDLDRGEVLPNHSRWDLKRTAFLTGVDHEQLGHYLKLPDDFAHGIDTAGVVLISRALASAHRERADRLAASIQRLPQDAPAQHIKKAERRANADRDVARRWAALSKTMLQGSR